MFTPATNFLTRHAFVVMPKAVRKPPQPHCSSATRCHTARCCGTAACSLSSIARSATAMRVLLYERVTDRDPSALIEFNPRERSLGRYLERVRPRLEGGPVVPFPGRRAVRPEPGTTLQLRTRGLIDPYARALAGRFLPSSDGIVRPPKCVVVDDTFDWKGDRHLKRPLVRNDHLRDARPRLHAQHHQRRRSSPGTYAGVVEKIPYLKSLGVTAVELMPIHEFPTEEPDGSKPTARQLLGLRSHGLLRPASRLHDRPQAGRPGPPVQRDGPRAARGRHRSDSRRRVQSHGRRQRDTARRSASRAWKTASITCSTTTARTRTIPAAAIR